ncbi:MULTISPECIES: glycosyltransferase [unclassified Janthinobacterium]|uniref:glycosyltransferase n=1 Tax=unclassified Janthinobacterium TaxID=2610881 RepID=UPI00034764A7|nr:MULTISPECIES: glycosyltransferase [unclassified Janthinobacterium]MEC5163530.1 glycosyltransferase involved in cell wall biosynthesis [Janthinobacterium sp. CG_S6]
MKIILFCHPRFLPSQSMPRFANMLKAAYDARGHQVEMWSPQPRAYHWVPRGRLSKWAGYIDQFIFFPRWVAAALKGQPDDVLYVFCDQALGPWVPLVKDRPHVVHCHDLLALRSALGLIPENPTGWSGRLYQRYIRRGFRQARHFISVSTKSKVDLREIGGAAPLTSEVVYNGLSFPFARQGREDAAALLRARGLPVEAGGMLFHVGGGQWYKNRAGMIRMYASYAASVAEPLPLWCLSPEPNEAVRAALAEVPPRGKVLFFQGFDNETLQAAYSYARAFLFPSHAEGFGWPLVEAQACGCPVLTTDDAPMNEVAGPHSHYVPPLRGDADVAAWAAHSGAVLRAMLELAPAARARDVALGLDWAARFSAELAIDGYLRVYQDVLARPHAAASAAAPALAGAAK